MPNMILVNVWGLPQELPRNSMLDLLGCIHVTLSDGLMSVPREEKMINIIFGANLLDKFVRPGRLISIEVRGLNYTIAEPWFREAMQHLVDHIKESIEVAGFTCDYVECRLYLPNSYESRVITTALTEDLVTH